VFDPSVYALNRASAAAQEQLARELRRGLDAGEFEVHYQPILRIADADGSVVPGPMYAVEALVRWRHPHRGLLAAGTFIDTAERHGFLPELGELVVRSACGQLAAWDREVGAGAPRLLFVNVSPLELLEPELVRHVASSLGDAGLDPHRLTVEITETGLLQQSEAAERALHALLDLGCALAIDDFGTGYSSLSRLVDIPAATIKVDQAFTHRLGKDASAAAVISAVVTLGQKLRRTIVAEGVEDRAMQQELHQLGIRHVQGFHLAVPVSGAEMTGHLRRTTSGG
jgi:EAL domain-containing protein (putative c-di-GMP-specific phosphodiesterase class I)